MFHVEPILLLGLIVANPHHGCAVFSGSHVVRPGESISGYRLEYFEGKKVVLTKKDLKIIIKPGDYIDDNESMPISLSGYEANGKDIKLTSILRDYIVGQGLSKIMMQASAEPYYEKGEQVGYILYEIDPGSIFEIIGLINGDTVIEINDQKLTNPMAGISALRSIIKENNFSFKFIRDGHILERNIIVK